MESAGGGRRGRYVYHGWWIVLSAFVGNVIFSGIGLFAIGLFFKPMSDALGWSRAATSGAMSLRTVAGGLSAPVIGLLLDRYGARPIMLVGAITAGLATIALGSVNSLWQFYLLFGFVAATGMMAIGGLVVSTAVAKWFIRLRGRAMGLADLGSSVGITIFAPVVAYLILNLGWRMAWVALGIIALVILVPASLLMRRSPEDEGLVPDYGRPRPGEEAHLRSGAVEGQVAQEQVWTAREALRTPTFWLLISAFNVGGIALMGILLHQIPYITDSGFSQGEAAIALSIWAVFSGFSRLLFGFAADRIHVRYLTVICMLGSALGVANLLYINNLGLLYLFGVVYGLFRGAYILLQNLVWANYFGRAFLGTIRGFVMPLTLISYAGGPLLAGFVYDIRQSYGLALWVFLACYLLAGILIYLAKPPSKALAPAITPSPGA